MNLIKIIACLFVVHLSKKKSEYCFSDTVVKVFIKKKICCLESLTIPTVKDSASNIFPCKVVCMLTSWRKLPVEELQVCIWWVVFYLLKVNNKNNVIDRLHTSHWCFHCSFSTSLLGYWDGKINTVSVEIFSVWFQRKYSNYVS